MLIILESNMKLSRRVHKTRPYCIDIFMDNIKTMTYPFTNVPLPYGYSGLEPYIDMKTMQLHHDRHLQTYIDNLNAAIRDNPQLTDKTLEELILMASSGEVAEPTRTEIIHNAGGVYNHFFYFNELKPNTGDIVLGRSARLTNEMGRYFGGYDGFKQKLKTVALGVFGSGYAWLTKNRNGELQIVSTANQTTPLPIGVTPLLNIDVWEHAYYLKNYNDRAAYFENWWKVIDWAELSRKLENS
jgi:Fe-Mn family superoxide dismutase